MFVGVSDIMVSTKGQRCERPFLYSYYKPKTINTPEIYYSNTVHQFLKLPFESCVFSRKYGNATSAFADMRAQDATHHRTKPSTPKESCVAAINVAGR
jgi:hypothetical protein